MLGRKGFSMRIMVLLLALVFLTACTAGGGYQTRGAGVQTQVMNHHELRDVYFNYGQTEFTPTTMDDWETAPQGDWIDIARISTFVQNTGYADSLVALYITGYDPNLIFIDPLGPYQAQHGNRYCYKDIFIESDVGYRGYLMCAAWDDVFLGIGVSGNNGIDAGRIDAYNVNVGNWIDQLASWMTGEETTLFGDLGLFNDLDVSCGEHFDESEGAHLSVGGEGCEFSWGIPSFFFSRSSRGQLLIAMQGDSVRQCKNGCTLVPAPGLGRDYLGGDNELTPGGEGVFVDYGVYLNRGRWPPNFNDHSQMLQLTSCYLYTTYATPTVCIDPSPGTTTAEVCQSGLIRMDTPQPAPLRISRIEQANQGPRVAFTIHVENMFAGDVFDPGAVDFCSPASPELYSRELKDVARIVDARVLGSLEALDCRDGRIRMRNGRGQITCFYDLPPNVVGRTAYQTALNIEIGYLYRDIQTLQTNIHRI